MTSSFTASLDRCSEMMCDLNHKSVFIHVTPCTSAPKQTSTGSFVPCEKKPNEPVKEEQDDLLKPGGQATRPPPARTPVEKRRSSKSLPVSLELVSPSFQLYFQINIWINPFIYGYMNRDFRRAFRVLLRLKSDSQVAAASQGNESENQLSNQIYTVKSTALQCFSSSFFFCAGAMVCGHNPNPAVWSLATSCSAKHLIFFLNCGIHQRVGKCPTIPTNS